MKLRVLSLGIALSLFISLLSFPSRGTSNQALAQPELNLEQAQQVIQQSRSFFTENKGQWDPAILFIGNTDFGKVAFTEDAIYYQRGQAEELIQLSFVDGGSPVIEGLELLPHYHNYFIGNDPSKWATKCRNYAQVTYTDIWEGIDLAYFFSPEGLKYEYYVHPGANIEDLNIQVKGAELHLDNNALHMETTLGTLKDDRLLVFGQDSQKTLRAGFSLEENRFSFAGIPAERSETFVIDPLVYSTYLGGTTYDFSYSMAIDAMGNAYIAGETSNTDFPMNSTVGGGLAPGYDQSHNGAYDAFVVKLNASGTELLYATFLGGSDGDQARTIALDSSNSVYIAGNTYSNDFPMNTTVGGPPAPGYDQSFNGGDDAFAVKLNASGTELLYSIYLGGNAYDYAERIAIDALGSAYVVGSTSSLDFSMSTTVGGPPAPGYDKIHNGAYDAYLVKLNASGTELLYATFLGGADWEFGRSLSIDASGNAYIVGDTYSFDFPMGTTVRGTRVLGYDQKYHGNSDVFVVKINASGTELLNSTYLGGSLYDNAYSIAIDTTGNAYIVGRTNSTDFPMSTMVGGPVAQGYDHSYNGGNHDAFVVKLNASGTQLLYATFLGGDSYDVAHSIAIDASGNAYIAGYAGYTSSSDFPISTTVSSSPAPGYDQTYHGSGDAVVVKLNASGTELLYATYLGGSGHDYANSIAIDATGNAYIAGYTSSSDFPMRTMVGGPFAPGYDQIPNGDYDAFALKLDLPKPVLELTVSADDVSNREGDLLVLTVELRNTGSIVASACEVSVTLPPELAFQSYQLIVSLPGTGNSRIFTVGNLPADGSISFPVFAEVVVNVPANTSVKTAFDAICLENATASTTHHILLIHKLSPPHLRIWAEVNKPTFSKGEEALISVTVVNQGELVASNTRVQMTLPQELSFLRASRYRSVALTPSLIEFELGAIAPNSLQTFQVDVKVLVAVSQLRSIPVHFDVNCTEKSYDFSHVLLQLIPQRSGRPDLYLGLYYRNASWDPQTASVYIPQDTPLEIDFVLTGAQAPYELSIDWGDGETEVLSQQTDLRQTLRHQFKNKGKLTITIAVTDQLQRSKTAILSIEVR